MVFRFILVSLFLLGLFITPASANTNWEVAICNTCDSEISALNIASNVGNERIVVFNMTSELAFAFKIHEEKEPGFEVKFAVPASLPEGSYKAIDAYNQLMDLLDSRDSGEATEFVANSLNTMGSSVYNGCGNPSEPFSYAFLSNTSYPFTPACNTHDTCYSSGRSKQSCDSIFLREMLEIIDDKLVFVFSDSLLRAVIKMGLQARAQAYYYAVANSTLAMDAYCNASPGFSPECNGAEGFRTGESVDSLGPTQAGYSYTGSCELWQFPDGSGGYYYMNRNCTYQRAP